LGQNVLYVLDSIVLL